MKTQMLKMAAVSIYKTVSSKFNKTDENGQILDPITTIFKLCIISYKLPGVKISISNNRISYQETGYTQGIFRWSNGDKANDLHNLHNPINIFINDSYNYELFGPENYIFTLNLAKNGLKKLKSSYSNNPIIKNSINNYIKEINECLTNIHKQNQKQSQKEKQVNQNTSEKIDKISKKNNNEIKDEEEIQQKEQLEQKEKNSLYIKFKEIWNKRQISILVDTFQEIQSITNLSGSNETLNKYDMMDDYILSVMNILEAKDKNVLNIIQEIFAGH